MIYINLYSIHRDDSLHGYHAEACESRERAAQDIIDHTAVGYTGHRYRYQATIIASPSGDRRVDLREYAAEVAAEYEAPYVSPYLRAVS